MHFTGSMRPLLMLEFQGYLDYLKVVENKISFWEMKTLEINHQVGPCNFDNRIITLDATSHLEVYLPGKIGEVSIHLAYSSNKEKQEPFCRWKAIVSDNEK